MMSQAHLLSCWKRRMKKWRKKQNDHQRRPSLTTSPVKLMLVSAGSVFTPFNLEDRRSLCQSFTFRRLPPKAGQVRAHLYWTLIVRQEGHHWLGEESLWCGKGTWEWHSPYHTRSASKQWYSWQHQPSCQVHTQELRWWWAARSHSNPLYYCRKWQCHFDAFDTKDLPWPVHFIINCCNQASTLLELVYIQVTTSRL